MEQLIAILIVVFIVAFVGSPPKEQLLQPHHRYPWDGKMTLAEYVEDLNAKLLIEDQEQAKLSNWKYFYLIAIPFVVLAVLFCLYGMRCSHCHPEGESFLAFLLHLIF